MLNLASLDDIIIEAGTKGLPANVDTIPIGDVGQAGWKLHADLQLPAAVLRRSALDNNGAWMRAFAEHLGVVLCPHGKTTMAPQLFDRQLRDGAWGLSCATIAHLRLYRRFGVKRVIFANQIVSPAAANWLARELAEDPTFEIYVFVDSQYGVDLLAAAARAEGLERPIAVLVEFGAEGCRTGVRGLDAAIRLAFHVARSPGVVLAGVATFEGIVPGRTDQDMEPYVEALLGDTVRAAEMMARANLFDPERPVILSAGGSRFFDLAALRLKGADLGDRASLMVLRSGCYISHDALQYELAFERLLARGGEGPIGGRLRSALEVWAEIQSWPEPGWMFANIGRRDVSYDADLPQAFSAWRPTDGTSLAVPPGALTVRKLSDQHAHITAEQPLPLEVGDHVGFGISHPCTTFDKWRILFEVDDDDVVVDAIATFF